MRNKYGNLLTNCCQVIFLGIVSMLPSCNFFTNPLPVDSENIYQFPELFRGMYSLKDDTVIVEENKIRFFGRERMNLINGIFISPSDTATGIDSWKRNNAAFSAFESTQSVKFDSLNHPVDTLMNYVVKGNKVYKISEKGLEPGYSFKLKGDTLYCESQERVMHLSPSAFLRKLTDSIWVLNWRQEPEWSDEPGSWWRMVILEKTKDGSVLQREVQVDQKEMAFYTIERDIDAYYFDFQWTKKDMLKFAKGDKSQEFIPLKK